MKNYILRGTLFIILSALSYTFVAAIVKHTADNVSPLIVVFIQLIVCLIIMSLVLLKQQADIFKKLSHSPNKKLHLLRTIFSLSNGYLFYYSLKSLPLVNSVLLMNTFPLFVPIFGLLFFHKKFYYQILLAISIGFIGVVIVLNPHTNGFNFTAIYAIGAAIFMALAGLLIRKASETDDSVTTAFYFFFFGTIISGLVSIPFWTKMDLSVYGFIMLSGVLLFATQYACSVAFQYIEASLASALFYSEIIFATLVNIFIFKHYPPLETYVGMVLIIIGGLLTIKIQKKIDARGT